MRGTKQKQRIGIAAMVVAAALVVGAAVLGTGIAAGARSRAPHTASAPARQSSAVAGTGTSIVASAPLANRVVVLYGDSLAWEAEDSFVGAFAGTPGVQVLTRTMGGTAICDWFDDMRRDAATLAPGVVVLEFSGNALTPCMEDADGHGLTGDPYWEHYRADAQTAISLFAPARSRVYLAGAPISRIQEATGDFHGGLVNAMYQEIASEHAASVAYVDAGASVLDHGRWTATLPCLPNEPCTGGTDLLGRGVNVVRAPDGGHFCPAAEEAKRGVVGACPIWSSGAFRYGNAMAAPVLKALEG
jgi:hypothetical protein